jgi:hypothetical protein
LNTLNDSILRGFSTHFHQRILSVLENPIDKKTVSQYIDRYPTTIRVLDYRDENSLEKFKEKVNNENVSLLNWRI